MRTIPPSGCLRQRLSWTGMTTGTASCFTHSPNAPTSPDCARDLSPVTPISSMRFIRTGLITAAPCRSTFNGPAAPPGVMKPMYWITRNLYREKFAAVLAILQPVMDVNEPEAGFYLWPRLPENDVDFARQLYLQQNLLVLPGRFLSRPAAGRDPGANRLRIALTAPLPRCIEAAERMAEFIHKPM